jgi:hypothetical protein
MIPTAKLDQQTVNQVITHLNHYKKHTKAQLQNTTNTLRETYNFGYDYFAMTNSDYSTTEIPSFLTELCQRCIEFFADSNLEKYQEYNNVIVSMYYAGYQLEPHIDVDLNDQITDGKKVDFYFGESVLGVVLVPDIEGKFYISEASSDNNPSKPMFKALEEEQGTVFLLQGKYRRYPYLHGVSKVKNKRISVTFRTVYFNK